MLALRRFDRFTKESNVTRSQAAALWQILDKDHSGVVSRLEFNEALQTLQQARAWLRYCPECVYRNTCPYCQECNASCSDCTESAFCASCWSDHPARHVVSAEDEENASANKRAMDTASVLRTNLLIKPLNWAYTSPMMGWLPVQQKAALRQALRHQQQTVDNALKRAADAEEAALKQLR